jgi:hypothetical protein
MDYHDHSAHIQMILSGPEDTLELYLDPRMFPSLSDQYDPSSNLPPGQVGTTINTSSGPQTMTPGMKRSAAYRLHHTHDR